MFYCVKVAIISVQNMETIASLSILGITIKSKETSSKLASYPAMKSLATHSISCTGLLFVSVKTNLQDLFNPYFGSTNC